MRSRRAAATPPGAPAARDDGYGSLSVAEVLADLPSLDSAQLLLVKSLEEAGERRPVILDRIEDLLVVQEAAHHVQTTRLSTPPAPPPVADRALSDDLLDQMGDLLAKDSARRATAVRAQVPPPPAFALPEPAGPGNSTKSTKPGKAAKAARKVPSGAPNGLIVPTDGRRSRGGRGSKLVMKVVVVALVAAAGGLAWKLTHPTTSKPAAVATVGDPVAARLITAVPAGYTGNPIPWATPARPTWPKRLATTELPTPVLRSPKPDSCMDTSDCGARRTNTSNWS